MKVSANSESAQERADGCGKKKKKKKLEVGFEAWPAGCQDRSDKIG